MQFMEAVQLEGYGAGVGGGAGESDLPHHCLILKYKSSTHSTWLAFAARDRLYISKTHYYKIKVQLNYEAVWNTQYQDRGSYLQSK